MGPIVLATISTATVDIAAAFGDINHEWTNNTGIGVWIRLNTKFSGLNTGGASSIATRTRILTSGTLQGFYNVSWLGHSVMGKEATSDSVATGVTVPTFVPAGDTFEFRFDSNNASDTTATVVSTVMLDTTNCLHSGILQSATGATATLASTASAVNDFYNGAKAVVVDGAGKGQVFRITDYIGASKVATFDKTPVTTLDNTSIVAVIPDYLDPTVLRTTVADRPAVVDAAGLIDSCAVKWGATGAGTAVLLVGGLPSVNMTTSSAGSIDTGDISAAVIAAIASATQAASYSRR